MNEEIELKRIIDLRGCDAERMPALTLTEDKRPDRLEFTTVGTPFWEAAKYEVRKVAKSDIPGINAGDMVLFSRCAPDFADD